MRCVVVALGFGLALGQATDPMGQALEKFDKTQLNALGLAGSFLERQGLHAPWMKYAQKIKQVRQLQVTTQEDEKVELPAACKTACPQTEAVMKALESKMNSAMIPHMADMQKMQADMGGADPTPEQLPKMMKVMTPLLKDIMDVTFEDMCTNKASYTCLQTNANVCSPKDSNTISMGMSFNDPTAMAKDYGPMLNCFCDKCPGSRKAFTDMTVEMMGVMMSAMLQMVSAMQSGKQPDANAEMEASMKTDLLKAICPMVGMQRCFDANPSECGNIMNKGAQGITMTKPKGQNKGAASDKAEMKAECTKAGVATEGAAMQTVSTAVTLKGLDYDKVISNPTIKDELKKRVKAKVLANLPGYSDSDLSVALSSGSVVATVTIKTMPGSSPAKLQTALTASKDTVAAAVLAEVKSMPASDLQSVLSEGTTAAQLTSSAKVAAPSTTTTGTTASGSYAAGVAGLLWAVLAGALMSATM